MIQGQSTAIDKPEAAPSRFIILDLETRMDDFARRIVNGGRPSGKTHIMEVVCATVMSLELDPGGSIAKAALESFHMDDFEEATILANVDDRLSRASADGAQLVTYNGTFHDLSVLKARLLRWWQFGSNGVETYLSGNHLDLAEWMRAGGRGFPSLRDACAGIGISLRCPNFVGNRDDLAPYECMKCELDVLGTAILLLHYLAEKKHSAMPLTRALPKLGNLVRRLSRERRHFETLAANPMFKAQPGPWGLADDGATGVAA